MRSPLSHPNVINRDVAVVSIHTTRLTLVTAQRPSVGFVFSALGEKGVIKIQTSHSQHIANDEWIH